MNMDALQLLLPWGVVPANGWLPCRSAQGTGDSPGEPWGPGGVGHILWGETVYQIQTDWWFQIL